MITNISQMYPQNTLIQKITSGKVTSNNNEKLNQEQKHAPEVERGRYDFTNMSRNEMSMLFASGEIDLGGHFPPLILPEGGIDLTRDTAQQMEAVSDRKINYIEFLEGRIEFNKSVNQPTKHYETMLHKMLEYQGMNRSPKVDAYA